jgi:meso-butanediol dehydrogenase/(S,S)-butanediol dehydrogenase/diacetyl reductase
MNRLANKKALITGGGAGIGAATARIFVQEGASVLLVDRDPDALARTAQAIREAQPGAVVEVLAADVSDAAKAVEAVQLAKTVLGGIDVLVCNAAMRNYSPLAQAQPEEWTAMLNVNLLGPANYVRAALPLLRESGKSSIVLVSSCYAVTGRAGMGIYDTTKSGLLAMTRTLAFEEVKHGVRVNSLCPGSTLTEFHVGRAAAKGKDVETLKNERDDTSLMGRWAHPDEIAYPILWLASDEASYITGSNVMVDGGLSAM